MTYIEGQASMPVDDSHNQPDIIIEGGILLTMVDGESPIHNVRILIKKDRIFDIRPVNKNPVPDGVEFIDARKAIIMPGLINSHAHTPMTLFRGYADDLPLREWLFNKIFPAEATHLNPETVYWGTLLGCLEMIASGTTSVIDGYFFQNDTARAFKKSGLRAILAQGVIDFPAPGVSDPAENLAAGLEFIEEWYGASDLLTPGLFCHSLMTCSQKTLHGASEISRKYSLPMQIHLSETSEEVKEVIKKTGRKPVVYLDELGILGENLIAAHSIHLDDEEINLLRDKDVKIVHLPESNMKLASGISRVSEMLSKGLTVGIGTDGCASNNNLDLFKEMDSAAKLSKVMTLDPEKLPAEVILKMATTYGSKIIGHERDTGTIERGKKADIIVMDTNRPHLVPLYNPISTIVYSATGADIKDVIVNGKILMKERQFQTLDPEEILARVREISQQIK